MDFQNIRNNAYDNIKNPSISGANMKKSKLCKSIHQGIKCPYGARCNYAHSEEELVIPKCFFGSCCRYVRLVEDGIYENTEPETVCMFRHPDELKQSVEKRKNRTKREKPKAKTVSIDTQKPILKRQEAMTNDDIPVIHIKRSIAKQVFETLLTKSELSSFTIKFYD